MPFAIRFNAIVFVVPLIVATDRGLNSTGHVGLFLGSRAAHIGTLTDPRLDLLHELERVVGLENRIATERRVDRLVEAMRPLFKCMPKDSRGRVDSRGVKYMLQRVFAERHGWFVKGLGSENVANQNFTARNMLQHDVGSMFEEKLHGHGFDLHQSAVLAAALEHFVHSENIARLKRVYSGLRLNTDELLEEEDVDVAMQIYMLKFTIRNTENITITKAKLLRISHHIEHEIPSWQDILSFVREIRKSFIESDVVASTAPTSWSTTLKTLEEVGERYGRWQNKECMKLKRVLVDLGDPSTGRVPLESFYSTWLSDNKWLFFESIPYLRELGALDESDPSAPTLIIPNYVNAHSNCLASSNYYDVCCISECNGLLKQLEEDVAAPQVLPDRLIRLVEVLSSDTVTAPRSLPASLLTRLSEIAAQHKGMVPLHGRLFAQWMHHAFPLECPYPHISGNIMRRRAVEFSEETGLSFAYNESEARDFIKKQKDTRAADGVNEIQHNEGLKENIPWTQEEELFVLRADHNASGISGFSYLSVIFPAVVGFKLTQMFPKLFASNMKISGEKYFV